VAGGGAVELHVFTVLAGNLFTVHTTTTMPSKATEDC
jgi:hypothetical protein